MGAIAGAIRLDDGAPDRALTARMCAALAHRRPCSILDESASGPSIAFDGRIDNRADLATALSARGPHTDVELALAAFVAWGEGCAARLLGDFAFVIRDPASRTLLCIRDIVGTKPFFYAVVDGTFLFASELHTLFQHPRLERVPNEEFVAELLNDTVTSRDETLFRDVRRLPPAHLLRVDTAPRAPRRYWQPSFRRIEAGRDDPDYAAELKSILAESVACRIELPRAAAQLSGGLDSSAVVAIAATLPHRPAVHTYSLVFPGRPFDESQYIAKVLHRFRVRNTQLCVDPWDPQWFAREAEQYLECPLGPTPAVLSGMYSAARTDGFASMLTGEGADEWFTGSVYSYADLLARGAMHEVVLELVNASNPASAVRRLMMAGVWPLLPRALRRTLRTIVRAATGRGAALPWLNPAFARRTAVVERCRRAEYDRTNGMSRATWGVAQYLLDGTQALAFEIAERIAARFGLEERHPFYDRRIIEFALTLPDEQRALRGVRKRVLRRAVAGLLPDAVCLRPDKADFTPLYRDWFAAVGGEAAFDRLWIADAGWVRSDVLKREYRRATAGPDRGPGVAALPALWTALAVEAWFRAAVARDPIVVRDAVAVP